MSRHERLRSDVTAQAADSPDRPAAIKHYVPKLRRLKLAGLGLAGLLALGLGGWSGAQWWTTGRFMEKTDDAYVAANITLISSRVQGYVAEIAVAENASVKAGDVLVWLDDGDYRIALQTAESRVTTAGERLARIDAQSEAARAAVAQARAMQDMAQAQLQLARTNAERSARLVAGEIAAQSTLDDATEKLDTARATLANADAALASAQAQVDVLKAERAEAEGTREELKLAQAQAHRNLDLTVLRAPVDGTLTNVTLELGDLVVPGARLAALVPRDGLYIEANFKETQIAGIVSGAPVHMSFDALPDTAFEGRVASLAPATGSVFSLLPPDNATGNFTKIVQRVPVRIEIPADAIATGALRAGLSAVVEVDTRAAARPAG